MKQPWEQDPDAWKGKTETTEMWERFAASVQQAMMAFQRLSDTIAVWALIHGKPKERE